MKLNYKTLVSAVKYGEDEVEGVYSKVIEEEKDMVFLGILDVVERADKTKAALEAWVNLSKEEVKRG